MKTLFWTLRAMTLAMALCAAPAAQAAARAPEQTAEVFYRWYVEGLSASLDPLRQSPQHMGEFVSAGLMGELKKQARRPGQRADYFIQAQDVRPDWNGDIAVSRPRIVGKWATVIVTLGASAASSRKLVLTMAREGAEWKIRMVRLA